MIYKKFINPGAYSIFINQMKRDGLKIGEINEIFDFSGDYARFILQDGRQPKYKQVVKSDISLKNYFHSNESYTRHLHKIVNVYEPVEILEWFDAQDDLDFLIFELGYTQTSFDRAVLEPLKEETISFLKLRELTEIIDLWEDSPLGDFDLLSREWYSGLVKRIDDAD